MTSTTLNPSLKHYLSSILAALVSFVLLFLPANPDNVILTVRGSDCGTDDFFDTSYCYIAVNMENRTNRAVGKPDYAILEKETDGEWLYISKGRIPQEDTWTMMHSVDITETFCFSLGNEHALAPGEYRITVYYSIQSLASGFEGQSSTIFTVS